MHRALLHEIEHSKPFLPKDERITTLYIGGGTPSLFSVDMLESLIYKVKEKFNVYQFEEVTIETNPDDLTDNYLAELSKTECNRLSIGVQSFDDDILKFLGRRHTGSEAIAAIERAKKHGFTNLSLDLIYGIPGESIKQLHNDIKTLLSLSPTHISAYHLTFEERSLIWKMLQRGEIAQVEEIVSEQHFALVSSSLKSAGYNHYEVSNFAKDGYKAIHNSNYWKSVAYMGYGPSAHSFNGQDERRWNYASNMKYLRMIESGEKQYENEILTPKDRINEELMTLMRCSEGVDLKYLDRKYNANVSSKILTSAKRFIELGEITQSGDILKIESENFLKSDYIISSLFIN